MNLYGFINSIPRKNVFIPQLFRKILINHWKKVPLYAKVILM